MTKKQFQLLKNSKVITLLLLGFFSVFVNAQKSEFARFSKEDVTATKSTIDPEADAEYLYRSKEVYYDYDSEVRGWEQFTKVHERIKIYSKEGYAYATNKIRLFEEGGKNEKLMSIKAMTFYVDHGKVVKRKLQKKDIYDEKKTAKWEVKTFTMPDVTEGVIVEWEYVVRSPFISFVDEVMIQSDIPVKVYYGLLKLPEYFNFEMKIRGYRKVPYTIRKENFKKNTTYRVAANPGIGGTSISSTNKGVIEYILNVYEINDKDIIPLRKESFVNNIKNYQSACVFDLSYYKSPSGKMNYFSKTWQSVKEKIFESPSYSSELKKRNYYRESIDAIIAKASSDDAKIIGIFSFMKNKIRWNGNYGKYTEKGVRRAFVDGSGNVADVNLALVSMLQYAELNAFPVVLSSRHHTIPLFPSLKDLNYVVAGIDIEGGTILLDATDPYGSPGILPMRALNWKGLVIEKVSQEPRWINLTSSEYGETISVLNYSINENIELDGVLKSKYTSYKAAEHRNKWGVLNKESLMSRREEILGIEIKNYRLSNQEDISKPLIEMLSFVTEDYIEEVGGKLYIEPLLFMGVIENPFTSDKRYSPIDFGYVWEDSIVVNMSFPEGYELSNLPSDKHIELEEGIGGLSVSYLQKEGVVQINYKLLMNHGVVPAVYYSSLKNLYEEAVSKHKEKIVLTKK